MTKKLFVPFALTALLSWTVAHGQTDTTIQENMFALKADLLFPTLVIIGGNTAVSLTGENGFKKRHSIQITTELKLN